MKFCKCPGLFVAMALFFSLSSIIGCKKPQTPEPKTEVEEKAVEKEEQVPVVAVVNEKPIEKAQFDDMFEKMTRVYTQRGKEIPENVAQRYSDNITNRLIERELITQEVKRKGITVTEEELEESLETYKEMFRTQANFQRYLETSKTTMDKIMENLRYNKALEKLLNADGPIEVTEEEIQEYYEGNKHRYMDKERRRIRQIMVMMPRDADEEAKKAGEEKIQDLHKKAIAAGADFGKIAMENSGGPRAKEGGDQGYITQGRLPVDVDKVAFSMELGKISVPIASPTGWHIVKVESKKEPSQLALEDVNDSIHRLLKSRKERVKQNQILRELREKASIVLTEQEESAKAPTKVAE